MPAPIQYPQRAVCGQAIRFDYADGFVAAHSLGPQSNANLGACYGSRLSVPDDRRDRWPW